MAALSSSDHHLKPSAVAHALLAPPTERATRPLVNPPPERTHDDPRPATSPPNGPVTAALATPHDAVLADLRGAPREPTPPTRVDAPRGPKLNVLASVGSLARTERTPTPSAGGRSAAATPGVPHEPLLDPFSGADVGTVVPRRDAGEPLRDGSCFDRRREELWTGLANIRELQGEVARLHVQMEGVGLGDGRGGKRAAGAVVGVGRVHSDTIAGGDERWDEAEGGGAAADAGEEQRKRARDAEFTNLAETFKGRRDAIEAIMGKVRDSDWLRRTIGWPGCAARDWASWRTLTDECARSSGSSQTR